MKRTGLYPVMCVMAALAACSSAPSQSPPVPGPSCIDGTNAALLREQHLVSFNSGVILTPPPAPGFCNADTTVHVDWFTVTFKEDGPYSAIKISGDSAQMPAVGAPPVVMKEPELDPCADRLVVAYVGKNKTVDDILPELFDKTVVEQVLPRDVIDAEFVGASTSHGQAQSC